MPSHYYHNTPSNRFMSAPMYQENRPRYDMDPLLAKLAEATVAPPAKTQNPLLNALATSLVDAANMPRVSVPDVPKLPAGYTDGTYGEFTDPQPVTFSQNPAPDVPIMYSKEQEAEARAAAEAQGLQVVPVPDANGNIIGFNLTQPDRKVEDMINSARQIIQNAE